MIIQKYDLKNMGLSEWEQCFMSGKIAEVINPNNKYGNMGFIFSILTRMYRL